MGIYNLEPIEDKDRDFRSKLRSYERKRVEKKDSEAHGNEGFLPSELVEKELNVDQGENKLAEAQKKVIEEIEKHPDNKSGEQNKKILSAADLEQAKIDRLVNLAIEKGPDYAFRVAKRMRDLYSLDKFHDILIEKFRLQLIEKGLIKDE